MPGDAPARVVALGYQGFGNLGDEAILTGIERIFDEVPITVTAVITGPHPDQVPAFQAATRIPAPRLLPTYRALRAIRRADALVLSGGGLVHDHWATVLPRYLAWILAARLLGRPVIWLSVGVGPLRRRPWREMARLAARLSRLVIVRDEQGARLLAGAGRPSVAPDAAVFNDQASSAGSRGREVGIIVRDPGPAGDAWRGRLVDALSRCCVRLANADHPPVLLTMAGLADTEIVNEVRVAIERLGGPTPAVEALGPSVDGAIGRLATLHGIVTVRLHGLILGLLAGTPCAAVGYDGKVSAVAEGLGVSGCVVTMDELNGDRLVGALEYASESRTRARAQQGLEAQREGRASLAQRVLAAVQNEGRRRA